MEIKTKAHTYHLQNRDEKVFRIKVSTCNVYLEEEIGEQEAKDMAVELLEGTVLDGCWEYEVVDKLLECGILNEDQILKWVEDNLGRDV